ncbi:MAG: methyltransferase domain-containing protein [Calditrichaeota bacterium]|nr:MAG: methyltransferase domain-containing protein [Calditrichota bacterium]
MLDVGTGSGILAILARKLGAARVRGIDVDPVALENAHLNARLNRVENLELAVEEVSRQTDESFDLVLANIHLSVHLASALDYFRVLRPGGLVVLSGILAQDAPRIGYVFKQSGLVEAGRMEQEGWVALVWERSQ